MLVTTINPNRPEDALVIVRVLLKQFGITTQSPRFASLLTAWGFEFNEKQCLSSLTDQQLIELAYMLQEDWDKLSPSEQTFRLKVLEAERQIEQLVGNFGLSCKSVFLSGLFKANGFPPNREHGIKLLEDNQKLQLRDILQEKWESLSPDTQAMRLKVNDALKKAGLSWEDKSLRDWVIACETAFTSLQIEQLQVLFNYLEENFLKVIPQAS